MRKMTAMRKMAGSAALAVLLLGGAVAPAFAGERPAVVAQARTGEVEVVGTLEAVNGSVYTVAGRRVVMARTAEIQAGLVVGDTVKVHATNRAGVLVGREIERVAAAAPAAPTAAPVASPVPTDDHGRGRGSDDGAGDDRGRGRGSDDGAGDDHGRGRGSDDGAGDDRGRGRGRGRG